MPPFVVLSDAAAIRDVFTGDPDVLYAGEGNRVLKPILGDGSVLLLDGPRHLRERRLVMPPFHGERMRSYATAMGEVTHKALRDMPLDRPFAIHEVMQAITLDVILRTVYGVREGASLDTTRAALAAFAEAGTGTFGTVLTFLLPPDSAESILRFGREPLSLGPLTLHLGRYMPWKRIVDTGERADELLYAQIEERRAAPKGESRSDVLSMLLDARDEEGKPMTERDLRDEMMTMLLAGHETSATTLAWTIHHLLDAPEVVERIRDEVESTVGQGPIRPEDLAKLDYVDAVIKESLRLTPILPIVARILKAPFHCGNLDLPRGIGVFPCIYLTHHDPDLYPDPMRFDPERFFQKKVDPSTYFPFGGGARRCVGMAFATFEMKLVLAELFRAYALRRAPGSKPTTKRRGITFAPSDGVRVLAQPRARAAA